MYQVQRGYNNNTLQVSYVKFASMYNYISILER